MGTLTPRLVTLGELASIEVGAGLLRPLGMVGRVVSIRLDRVSAHLHQWAQSRQDWLL